MQVHVPLSQAFGNAAPAAIPAAKPALFSTQPIETRLDRYEDEASSEDLHAAAAYLLASGLQPLIELCSDAEVTLPADELRVMLEALHNRIYEQRASIRSLVAIARGYIPVELLARPAFNGNPEAQA